MLGPPGVIVKQLQNILPNWVWNMHPLRHCYELSNYQNIQQITLVSLRMNIIVVEALELNYELMGLIRYYSEYVCLTRHPVRAHALPNRRAY